MAAAQAYVILAWGRLRNAKATGVEALSGVAWSAAQRLMECYRAASRPDWHWFEPRLTYANAVLPHALFVAAEHWPEEGFLNVAKASFAFLDHQTTNGGVFWPVGNEGWYPRGETKALYDQQPVEAATMADAALAAFRLSGDEKHLAVFRRAYAWFHGHNSLRKPLADVASGACFDGLTTSGVNRNQGAESTLAYLWTELCNQEVTASSADSRMAKEAVASA